jgi:hypothetical protein
MVQVFFYERYYLWHSGSREEVLLFSFKKCFFQARPQVKFDLCGDCSGEEYQIWTTAATSPGLNLLFEEVK